MSATIQDPNHFRLLSLPIELIQMVVAEVESREDLCALSLTCHHLAQLTAELKRFHTAIIDVRRDPSQSGGGVNEEQLTEFAYAISEKCGRPAMVRNLYFSFLCMELDDLSDDTFVSCLESLSTLEVLTLVSLYPWARRNPVPQLEMTKFFRLFRKASLLEQPGKRVLRSLRTCELQFKPHGDDFWPFGAKQIVFLHPSLRGLTIRQAEFPTGHVDTITSYKHVTALEELSLENCDTSPDALAALLGVPWALKRLTLKTTFEHHDFVYLTGNVNELFDAMSSQLESVESLTYYHHNKAPSAATEFGKFSQLMHLDIFPWTLLAAQSQTKKGSYWPRNTPLQELLPPSILTLTLSCVPWVKGPEYQKRLCSILCESLREKALFAPRLRTITFTLQKNGARLTEEELAVPNILSAMMKEVGVNIQYKAFNEFGYKVYK